MFVFTEPVRLFKKEVITIVYAANLSLPCFDNMLDDGCDIVNGFADHIEAYVLTDIAEVLCISTVIVLSSA